MKATKEDIGKDGLIEIINPTNFWFEPKTKTEWVEIIELIGLFNDKVIVQFRNGERKTINNNFTCIAVGFGTFFKDLLNTNNNVEDETKITINKIKEMVEEVNKQKPEETELEKYNKILSHILHSKGALTTENVNKLLSESLNIYIGLKNANKLDEYLKHLEGFNSCLNALELSFNKDEKGSDKVIVTEKGKYSGKYIIGVDVANGKDSSVTTLLVKDEDIIRRIYTKTDISDMLSTINQFKVYDCQEKTKEPEYVPFDLTDVYFLIDKKIKRNNTDCIFKVKNFTRTGIVLEEDYFLKAHFTYTYEELAEKFTFEDGSPCKKLKK